MGGTHLVLKKIKCTLVQALRLCTGRTTHRGSRSIPLLFLYTTLEGTEGSASRLSRSLPPGQTRYPLLQKAGCAPGPVWTGAENLAPTGIRSPDRPARSQSLCRLRYPTLWYGCQYINPLDAELNRICHLLALLGAHHIFRLSDLRIKY